MSTRSRISFNIFQQKVIERFPASLIEEPTAFTSDAPLDMYNNVLVFIVGGGSGTRSEMHIFQVSSPPKFVKLPNDSMIVFHCSAKVYQPYKLLKI